MSFFGELKRRNVVKVGILYVLASWLVLQVTEVLASILPVPHWSATLVFMLLVLGFIPALIFSWVYEITPSGIRREADVERGESIAADTGRRIDAVIVVLLALVIAAVIADRLFPAGRPVSDSAEKAMARDPRAEPGDADELERDVRSGQPSIAVLPFANLSPDPDQEYFSDGLSEELLSLLSSVRGASVISRTSAFSLKGKDVTIAEVAERLGVTHVLEGSVRKSGDRIRITAQLIDADRDVHLWSDSWDRTLGDVFAIQDEIAARVVEALRVTLLGARPRSPRTDTDAYALYLRAQGQFRSGSLSSLSQATDTFRSALAIDPDFVPAWVGLGAAYINLAGARGMRREKAFEAARAASESALAVDPTSARAYAHLSWIAREGDGNFASAARYLNEAIDRGPEDTVVLNTAAATLRLLGRGEESLKIYRQLVRRDPLSPSLHHNLGLNFLSLGQLPAAEASVGEALELSPDMVMARFLLARVLYRQGRLEEGLDAMETLTEETGAEVFRLIGQAFVYPKTGRPAEGARALAQLEGHHPQYAGIIGIIHSDQGRSEAALDWFEKALEIEGPVAIAALRTNPWVKVPADNPRWLALQRRAGVLEDQLAAIDLNLGPLEQASSRSPGPGELGLTAAPHFPAIRGQ